MVTLNTLFKLRITTSSVLINIHSLKDYVLTIQSIRHWYCWRELKKKKKKIQFSFQKGYLDSSLDVQFEK